MTAILLLSVILAGDAESNWPAFRGRGDSQTTAKNLPLEWSEDSVTWRTELPGYGQSSPIIWDGRVFVTSVEGELKDRLLVSAVELESGKLLWTKEFKGTQPWKDSDYVSKGAPTPAVDADRIYAFFESGDLIALDHDGNELWKRALPKDYGNFQGNHGIGPSPILTENAVVVLIDHAGPSYLAAFDKNTGETMWKTDRESRTSWTTPTLHHRAGKDEIVTSTSGLVQGYDAATGRELWQVAGIDKNTVPSPTVAGDLVVIGSTEVGSNAAIRLGGEGKLSEEAIAWRAKGVTSSFGSPLFHWERVYFVNKSGVAYCVDPASGEVIWNHRLASSCWASPIGAGDRIYFFTKDGVTNVIKPGDTFEQLAENKLPTTERVYGVAAVDNAFVIRTGRELFRVGK